MTPVLFALSFVAKADSGLVLRQAVQKALTSGKPLILPAGHYNAAGLPIIVPAGKSLKIVGAGVGKTVIDGGQEKPNDQPFFDCRGSIEVRELSMTRTGRAFSFDRVSGVIPTATFVHIAVDHSGGGIYGNLLANVSKRGIAKLVVAGCSFSSMTNGKGVYLQLPYLTRIEIHDSTFRNLLPNGSSSSMAICVGQDSRQAQLAGNNRNWLIERNVIEHIRHPKAANGIVAQSFVNLKVRNNTIRDIVTDTAKDCEGIYVKGDGYIIENNRLTDAGLIQGMIALKGEPRLESDWQTKNKSLGYNGVVRGNVLTCDRGGPEARGIFINHGEVAILNNTFTGLTGAALVNDASPSTIRSVKVVGNTFQNLKTSYAISIASDAEDWTVQNNTFRNFDFSGINGTCGAIDFETRVGSRLVQKGIKVLNNHISGLNGSAKRYAILFYAYSGRQSAGGTISGVTVTGNRVDSPCEVAVAYGGNGKGRVQISASNNQAPQAKQVVAKTTPVAG